MDDSSQIRVPDSFMALFVPAGRLKPTAPQAHIVERYELCEDLANHLVESARAHARDGDEPEVLARMHRGLAGESSGLEAREARWTVRRLAELLDWRDPGDALADEAPSGRPQRRT